MHVRKDKSNEFARFEMGSLTVDEYYHKFIDYIKYCPDDVSIKEKKMQRFKLGLSFDIQIHIKSDRYSTLDQMYKRVAPIRNILQKEKEKKKVNVTEKRKEMVSMASGALLGFYQKEPKTF